MTAIVSAFLTLLQMIAPGATTNVIASIIDALVKFIPILVQTVEDVTPAIQNIIAALRGNGNITPEQIDALDAAEASLDDAFDRASNAATTEDVNAASDPTK